MLRLFVLFEQRAHILGSVAYLKISVRLCVLSPGGCRSCLLLGAFRRLFHSVQKQPTFALGVKLLAEYTALRGLRLQTSNDGVLRARPVDLRRGASSFQRAGEGDLVGVFEVATHGQAAGETRHVYAERR